MELIVIIAFLFYILYTLSFAAKLNKKDSVYTTRQKILHNILIWIIPFIWINLLKYMDKETPGSHYYKRRRDSGMSYESGVGMFENWGEDSGGGDSSGGDGGGDGD